MSKDHVQFAVMIPKSMVDTILSEFQGSDAEITETVTDVEASDQSLNFDLAVMGDLVWYALEIVGPDAKNVAISVLAGHIYAKLASKRMAIEAEQMIESVSQRDSSPEFSIFVRLPSGRRIKFQSDNSKLLEELKADLEQQ